MSSASHTTTPPVTPSSLCFTIEQADRTLPYLQRVVADIQQAYRQIMSMHESARPETQTLEDDSDYQASMQDLRRYVDEIELVGVELKDYDTGLIEFPVELEGELLSLHWQLGDEKVTPKVPTLTIGER